MLFINYLCQICFIIGLIVNLSGASAGPEWNYEESGPNVWPKLFQTCASSKQSPINIIKSSARCNPNLIKPLFFLNYVEVELTFENIGHTIAGTPIDQKKLSSIIGSGLPGQSLFLLKSLHFHWGRNEFQGSEHLFDNAPHTMELHLIHESWNRPGQLAILGVMLQLNKNKLTPHFSSINFAARMLKDSKSGQKFNATLDLMKLLPDNLQEYYFYEGSLTTPPCSETVYWTVFEKPVEIDMILFEAFQLNSLKNNYRNPQPLNGRTVFKSKC